MWFPGSKWTVDSPLLPRVAAQAGRSKDGVYRLHNRSGKEGEDKGHWQVVPLLMTTCMHPRAIIEANLSLRVSHYQMAVLSVSASTVRMTVFLVYPEDKG